MSSELRDSISYDAAEADYNETQQAFTAGQAELLAEFEFKKKARQIHVSTDDSEVKYQLRKLQEPICLFGEDAADRRDRLRLLLAKHSDDIFKIPGAPKQREMQEIYDLEQITWYHEGVDELSRARLWIAEYSISRAAQRLQVAREQKALPSTQNNSYIQETHKKISNIVSGCSQMADCRPISCCNLSPDDSLLVTGSWTGTCKLWSVPNCNLVRTLNGHKDCVSSVAFHPNARNVETEDSQGELMLATSAFDGSVKLWDSASDKAIADLEGHAPYRVAAVRWHPSGSFLATCCYDCSWRLFDLEESVEILHQEGHVRPVHCMSFQCDGSLVVTGSLDGTGRVWDLRTGRCVLLLKGHQGPVLSTDFSPSGHIVATGSSDNTCKIWDLRQRTCVYSISAHTNNVSSVKFQKGRNYSGNYLVTGSYDRTVKIWTHPLWTPLRTLEGHMDKITSLDVDVAGEMIATTSFDRTVRIWNSCAM